MKFFDIWMFTCVSFVTGALVEIPIVHVLIKREQAQLKAKPGNNNSNMAGERKAGDSERESTLLSERVNTVMRVLFPVTFVLINMAFIGVVWA